MTREYKCFSRLLVSPFPVQERKIWLGGGEGEGRGQGVQQRTRAIEFPMVSLQCIIALSTSVHSQGYPSWMGNNGEHPRAPGFDHAAVALSAHNGSCLLDQTRVHNFCQRYVHKRERNVCVYLAVGYFSLIAVVPRVYSRPFMPYNIRSRIIRVICVFIERRIITTPPRPLRFEYQIGL